MSPMDMVYLVVGLAVVVAISSILPITAYKDYKYEKARVKALTQNLRDEQNMK